MLMILAPVYSISARDLILSDSIKNMDTAQTIHNYNQLRGEVNQKILDLNIPANLTIDTLHYYWLVNYLFRYLGHEKFLVHLEWVQKEYQEHKIPILDQFLLMYEWRMSGWVLKINHYKEFADALMKRHNPRGYCYCRQNKPSKYSHIIERLSKKHKNNYMVKYYYRDCCQE